MDSKLLPPELRVALVLGGGNALGAYHAGLYEALHEAELEPDWIVGTSIGAITGAIIAGNHRADRLQRLKDLWRPAAADASSWWGWLPDSWRRTSAVMETLMAGRPGFFGPLGSTGPWLDADSLAGSPGLYATGPMAEMLSHAVDFGLLNTGAMRLTVAAVDVETGEEVVLDSHRQRIEPDHVRASASLLTTFPAIAVDGRLLGDGGLSMNLPLDPVMMDDGAAPILCIASDLLPLAAPRPQTLGDVVSRMQDLTFAAQSARSLARWRSCLGDNPDARSITLAMAVYADQGQEVAGKAMDFSPASVRHRWNCGLTDGRALVSRLRAGAIPLCEPGLTVHGG